MSDKIQEIRKALESATQGKWEVNDFDTMYSAEIISEYPKGVFNGIASGMYVPNAHLITNAPEWLSYLLAELDTKDKQIERLKGLITFDTEYNELKINVEELIKERDMYADAMFSAVKELDIAKQENEQFQKSNEFWENQNKFVITPNAILREKLKRAIEALEEIREHCYSCGGKHSSPERDCIKIVADTLSHLNVNT